ncbi:MAG TPA: serine/threonine-protein kinase, partial [Streptosporangiaceae bacterium]|nr:serine/threonine-protein kinase [Streptosporangiaceae bacterium]
QPWLATAYVPGPSLAEAVAADGPLPAGSVLALAAGLAEGLAEIHAAGVVHRDLKPSNVLLTADGPRVIDFGISRAADVSTLTRAGLVMGSPGFMSPEQAEGRPVGPASDIFSLGAVLVFAATGEGPFGAGPNAALVYRIVHSQPRIEHVPADIRPVAQRCLAKNPEDRPGAAQLLADLAGARAHGAARSRPVAQQTTQPAAARRVRDTPGSTAGQPTRTVVPARGPATADRAGGVRDASGPRRRSRLLLAVGGLVAAFAAGAGGLVAVHVHDSHRYVPSRAATLSASPAGQAGPAQSPPAGTSARPQLPPPALVSPANGAIVGYSQRFVTLRWRPVRGAAAYLVQAKFCPPGGCSRTGPNRPYSSSVITVTVTHYLLEVGGNPALWRVTAIRSDGARGKPSPWWGFS